MTPETIEAIGLQIVQPIVVVVLIGWIFYVFFKD